MLAEDWHGVQPRVASAKPDTGVFCRCRGPMSAIPSLPDEERKPDAEVFSNCSGCLLAILQPGEW